MWHKHMHFLGRSHNPRGKQWLVCDEVKEENTNIYSWDQGGVDNNRTGVLLLILVVWLVQQSPMQIKEMEAFTFKVEILPFAVWFSVVPYRIGLVVLNWEPQASMSKPCCLVCLHRSISPAIHQCLGYLSPYKEVETHSSFNVLVAHWCDKTCGWLIDFIVISSSYL